jgi:hypothetical protein
MKRAIPSALAVLFAFLASAANAQEFRFITDNDLFTGGPTHDDLYTFAVGFELERDGTRYSLRENAFTDRVAGKRFDETMLSAGRRLPAWRSFEVEAEVGAVLVGRGLFGESTQNAVHRALGGEEVTLPYVDNEVYGRLALSAERSWTVRGGFDVGPRLELELIPGFRSHAVVAAQVRWEPASQLFVQAVVGARASSAQFVPLEPHIAPLAPIVRLEVGYGSHGFLAWSHNEYGDEREHLHVGYRVRASLNGAGRARSR